ncbi:hypothetical protein JZ751_017870 [Albula glossodonta]|uniref:Major facilitator superfamily (MFS) profile domain-containing protein n=1 Tax=Albula glossodonta TaxID=121402 RepID=A0A8T2PPL9_9TELE|nr:hypothetical protein JZ751_017870 [Albula glossodonta]
MTTSSAADLGYTPPDGGWGWAVVFGAFISIGFSYAFPKAITIYFKEIQEYFSVSYSEIAWVSSIMLAAMYGGGPVSSILVNRYGSRPVVFAGGIMCAVAMVRRPIANGLAMAGSPVFLCTLAPLNQFLFDTFGWRGSFFILGALLLNCCVAGALMRPIGMKPAADQASKPNGTASEHGVANGNSAAASEGKTRCMETMDKFIDLSLFKHRGFIIYLIGNVVMFFGFFAPIVFLAPYAKHLGVDEYSAAFLLSILAMVDMFARPGTGLVANTKWIRPRIQYFFSFSVAYNGVCHLLCPLATGYSGLVAYSIFFGIAFGMVCALLFECLMDQVGPQRFSSAVGLVTIIECCPVLLGPPIGGALVDIFKDYRYMYYTCGAVMLAAGVFLFIMNFYNYRLLEQERRQQPQRSLQLSVTEKASMGEEEEGEGEELAASHA